MASRTRMAPTRVQLRPQSSSTATTNNTTTEMDENGFVKCTGHGRRCSRLVAGPATKNPGRAFYTCPLGREDPKRCKFFKWEDELQSTAQRPPHGGRTLGESPRVSHAERTTTMITPSKSGRTPVQPPKATETIDEIDWDKVDTDELEHQAILSTPGSSQRASGSGSQDTPARERLRAAVEEGVSGSKRGAQDTPSRERLRAAVEEGVSKRKREDDDQTPKRARVDTELNQQNPFLNTPQTPRSPSHPVLSPALASLGEVSEHIDRQERLIRASDQMKQGLRKTISNLQEKNTALEARVRELEAKLAAR